MKTFKRILFLCLSLCVMMFLSSMGLSSEGYDFSENEKSELRNYISSDLFYGFMENLDTGGINQMPDDYAGAYVDNNGYLKIGITNDQDLTKYETAFSESIINKTAKNILDNPNLKTPGYKNIDNIMNTKSIVEFIPMRFSYNYLQSIHKILPDITSEFDITMTELKQDVNKMILYLKDIITKEDVIKYMNENIENFDLESIEFIEADMTVYPHATAYLGTEMKETGFLGITLSYGSIGCNARLNGEYGVLTNAHVVQNSTKTWKISNGTVIGQAQASTIKVGGKVDVAFVPFENQGNWDKNYKILSASGSNLHKETTGSSPLQGSYTGQIGARTGGTTGYIQSSSVNISVNYSSYDGTTKTISDVFSYDCNTNSGDSGGPVTNIGAGTTHTLIGLHFAGGGGLGYGIKIVNIHSAIPNLGIITYSNPSGNYK